MLWADMSHCTGPGGQGDPELSTEVRQAGNVLEGIPGANSAKTPASSLDLNASSYE